ncbi:unnamed protein product [Trichogramma brassicae]|uniref:Reverse transcriptase domain-containing protein n=1 Tax=Trichogramma brassicae TaxID=86971 RepID=A0A6H5IZT3_9HYME|nr:unnamed protein product [Trichogramma brassicae]
MATIVDFPVQHRIVTSGQPVFARPRRLAGDRLAAAKAEFKKLLDRGIIRPSSSQWAQSIAPRAEAWKHLEDHGRLPLAQRPYSTGSTPSAYHRGLASRERRQVFSVVDLYKAFYQIPGRRRRHLEDGRHDTFRPLRPRTTSAAPTRAPYHLEACEAVRQLGEVPDRDARRSFSQATSSPSADSSHQQPKSKRSLDSEALRLDTAATLYRHAEFLPPMLASRCRAHVSPHGSSPRTAEEKGEACMERSSRRGIRAHQAGYGLSGTISFLPFRPASCSAHRRLEYGYWCRVESAPRRRRLGAAGFLLAEVITNSAEVLNVRSRAAGHLRGDQIFSEDTRGSKLHHHDRSSPSVLRPRAEVGQVLASTVTSARLHLALRCQDRLHARRREPSGRRSISHRRDYDANDAQLGPNQRGTAEGRTTNTSPRQGETQASRRRDRRTFPCLRRAAKRPEAIPTRESTSPAEMVFGTSLRIPGEFVARQEPDKTSPSEFVSALRRLFQAIRPVPASRHVQHRPFVFKDLATSDYVFRRLDTILKPLEQPYTGPHRVIRRINERNFVVDVNGVAKTLSTDQLKPAYLDVADSGASQATPEQPTTTQPSSTRRVLFTPCANCPVH